MANTAKPESKPLVSLIALQPAAAVVKTAISGEDKAHDAWKKASKSLYQCGLRYSMIGGEDADDATRKEVATFIVGLLPEKMQRLLNLKGRDVAELDDSEKVQRKMYQQRIGVYLSRIGNYLKQHEGITVERGARKSKADAKPAALEHSMGAYAMMLQEMLAHRLQIGMTAKDADAFGNAVETALVIVKQAKAQADKLLGKLPPATM